MFILAQIGLINFRTKVVIRQIKIAQSNQEMISKMNDTCTKCKLINNLKINKLGCREKKIDNNSIVSFFFFSYVEHSCFQKHHKKIFFQNKRQDNQEKDSLKAGSQHAARAHSWYLCAKQSNKRGLKSNPQISSDKGLVVTVLRVRATCLIRFNNLPFHDKFICHKFLFRIKSCNNKFICHNLEPP